MVVIVVMIVMWTCHVDVVHTRILQADVEDEQLWLMLASPLYSEVSRKLDAECVQK